MIPGSRCSRRSTTDEEGETEFHDDRGSLKPALRPARRERRGKRKECGVGWAGHDRARQDRDEPARPGDRSLACRCCK